MYKKSSENQNCTETSERMNCLLFSAVLDILSNCTYAFLDHWWSDQYNEWGNILRRLSKLQKYYEMASYNRCKASYTSVLHKMIVWRHIVKLSQRYGQDFRV